MAVTKIVVILCVKLSEHLLAIVDCLLLHQDSFGRIIIIRNGFRIHESQSKNSQTFEENADSEGYKESDCQFGLFAEISNSVDSVERKKLEEKKGLTWRLQGLASRGRLLRERKGLPQCTGYHLWGLGLLITSLKAYY